MTSIESVHGPDDLRALSLRQTEQLAADIRRLLVEEVTRTGGHLGPSLGVVELTIALHRVFESPRDRIMWDTGHQTYAHKIITGRAGAFGTLRQPGGLSGYPSRTESEHDIIENSHASTVLSYADGLAKAYEIQGITDRAVVAVIGDGALTGGMAWEGLNNLAAARRRPVVVVLNDNTRSYTPTVGGIPEHLARLRTGERPPHSVFENMGLAYVGPVDGHDIAALERALNHAARLGGPVVVHCLTEKGRATPPPNRTRPTASTPCAPGPPPPPFRGPTGPPRPPRPLGRGVR